MERDTFDDGISWLEKYFGKSQTAEWKEHLWSTFGAVQDNIFSTAVQEVCHRHRNFPTPQELGSFVTEAREQTWQKEKGKELKNRHPLSQPRTGSPMVKELLMLLYRYFDRAITRKEYANELLQLHEKYPDFGLNKIATDIMLRISELPEKQVETQSNKNGGKNNGEQKESGQKGPTQTEEGQKRGTEPSGKPKWDIF